MFERSTVRVYIVIVAAVALLAVIAGLADLPLPVHVVLVAVTTLAVLLLNRDVLRVGDTFPFLLRSRLGRRIFGAGASAT